MDSFKKVAQDLLDEVTGMLSLADDAAYTSMVNNLLAAKNVVVAGEGRSRYVTAAFARGLSRLGRMVTVHGEAVGRRATRGDLLVVASLHGARGPLTVLAEAARKRGTLVCAFVGESSSVLASHAHSVIPIAHQTRTPFEVIAGAGAMGLLAFDEALMLYLDVVLLAVQKVLGIDARDVAEAAREE